MFIYWLYIYRSRTNDYIKISQLKGPEFIPVGQDNRRLGREGERKRERKTY